MNKHGFVAPVRKPVENVEELRKIWESDREWVSRKKFLDRHWGSIQPFELDSLSSVWLNNLVLGCRYPKATIERVKSLAEGLEVDNLTMLRGVPKDFVKGTEDDDNDDEADVTEVTPKKPPSPPKSIVGLNPFKKRKIAGSTPATPVVIDDNDDSAGPEKEGGPSTSPSLLSCDQKDTHACNESENNSKTFSKVTSATSDKLKYGMFVVAKTPEELNPNVLDDENKQKPSYANCGSNIENDSSSKIKKKAKKQKIVEEVEPGPVDESYSPPHQLANFVGFKRATSPVPDVVPAKKKYTPIVFDLEPEKKKRNPNAVQNSDFVSNFKKFPGKVETSTEALLLNQKAENFEANYENTQTYFGKCVLLCRETFNLETGNPKDHINRFVNFNKLSWEYVNSECKKGVRSKFYLNGEFLGKGIAESQKEAEVKAASEALELLRQHLPLIQIMNLQNETASYDPDSVHGYREEKQYIDPQKEKEKLESSNVGHKLLAKMGWTSGTGLGKNSQGRVDPVEAVGNRFRQGLGCEITPSSLRSCGLSKDIATNIIHTYIESCSEEPITFSSAFTNEDRKMLHFVAKDASKKYNVKLVTKSYGKEPNRYLTISRALTPAQLFDMATSVGRRFGKYKVLSVANSGE